MFFVVQRRMTHDLWARIYFYVQTGERLLKKKIHKNTSRANCTKNALKPLQTLILQATVAYYLIDTKAQLSISTQTPSK